ncbi:MAG: mechanosensitive ion channel family protein [Halioglobus sp.]|nr:mechanosensitive ion channel family protein [Halioglobus sp.]
MDPIEWINYDIFGNSLLVWASGSLLFLFVWALLGLVRRLLRKRMQALAEGRDVMALQIAAHVVDQTRGWFLFLAALFVGSRVWALPDDAELWLGRVCTIAFLLQAGFWIAAAFNRAVRMRRDRELKDNPSAVAAMDMLAFGVHVVVWSVVLLVMLDNLGVNITALVAGLGVGGIAVALAAQNILGDLFASLSIVLDKPFVVGDFLIIGEHMGSVEKVGIKTTRVRSLSGEQLIFSNNDLLSSRIRNYGRMFERRVVFSVGVTYQTTAEKLKKIPDILSEAVEACEDVRFDRAHFQKYGDFALIFEIVYYVLSPDYTKYMDIQQAVNLTIFERFADEDIEFAYPTQTVFLNHAAE